MWGYNVNIWVSSLTALDQDYSEQNRESCAAATKPLLDAVDSLCTFAGSPEFASQPAKISVGARAAQEPILSSGRAIIDGSCSMVCAAKSLAVSPRDPPTWQLLANHSKSVSDSIKKLVTSIRCVLLVILLTKWHLLQYYRSFNIRSNAFHEITGYTIFDHKRNE